MDVASPSPSGAAAWRWLVAPVAFGLAIRAVAVFAYERSILGACLGLDPEGHFEAAARISQGAWGEGHSLFSGGLLYPNFLALVFRVFGIGTLAPRVVQALIGTSTVALVGALGERLLSRRAGLIAAYACSLSAPLLLSELGFESEFLATFAAAAALFVLARDRARPFSYFVGGALLGACALTRPNLVLVSGFVAIWLAACVRPLKAAVTCVAVLSTGAALVIVPFAAHDDRLGAQGGYVFYVGHHPGASYHIDWLSFGDNSADGEFLAAWSEANRRAGRALTPAQASSYWFAEGLRSIAQDPERFARNSFARLRAFLCDYELPDNYDLAFVREQVPLLRFLFVSFGLALPFAALGVLRTTRRSALLLAVPFATLATVLVFYFNARFRVPALPFVLVFAADGLLFLVELVRTRSTVALLRAAPVAVLAGAAAFWPPQERFDFYYSYILVGKCASERDPASAERWLSRAVELAPQEADARVALSRLLMARGDLDRAERTVAPVSYDPGALVVRGEIASAQGRASDAIAHLEAAVKLQPVLVAAQTQLGVLYARSGRIDDAQAAFRRALAADPSYPEANVNAGILELERGEPREALSSFERALGRMQTKDVHLMACDAARRAGDPVRAQMHEAAARRLGATDAEVLEALR